MSTARFVVAVATTLGVATGVTSVGTASASSRVEDGLSRLITQANGDAPAQAAVAALTKAARATNADIATYAPFLYSSPTRGCGNSHGPFVFTAATGMADGTDPGMLRFQAAPAYSGVPTSSALKVAWINLDTGAAGIAPVDGSTDYNLPSLATTVRTGSGTVTATVWGAVNYTDAICTVAPTAGSFTVTPLPDFPRR